MRENNLSFLSQNICQDPLEVFFGCQRQRGDTSNNPSVCKFLKNTAPLRVVNSFCRGPATGNCCGPGRPSHYGSQKNDRSLSQQDITALPRHNAQPHHRIDNFFATMLFFDIHTCKHTHNHHFPQYISHYFNNNNEIL